MTEGASQAIWVTMLRIGYSLSFRLRRLYTKVVLTRFYGQVGRGTVIFSQKMVRHPHLIAIGDRSIIRYGGRIEMILHGQDWKPALSIGNNVNIEQNVHIICHDTVSIGDNVSITGNCAIVDVSHPINAIEQGLKIGDTIDHARSHVTIGDNCFIGFGSVILPNVTIGKNSIIGAGSVVTTDIPDDSIAAGVPAQVIRSRLPNREYAG